MGVIDAMPPPEDSCLEIMINGTEQDQDRPLWTVTIDRDTSKVKARFNSPDEDQSESGDSDVDLMISSIPCFKTVRPSETYVQSSTENGVNICTFLSSRRQCRSDCNGLSVMNIG